VSVTPDPIVTPVTPEPVVIGSLSQEVNDALIWAQTQTRDKGAVALARRYAALIDAAAPSAVYAEHLRGLEAALDPEMDGRTARHFQRIAEALAAHSVASDLGPKLLAVLNALGMTAAGRATAKAPPAPAATPATAISPAPEVPVDPLAELRARAAARRGG
jgi:hypothetical protein